jgi:hypothetical protein
MAYRMIPPMNPLLNGWTIPLNPYFFVLRIQICLQYVSVYGNASKFRIFYLTFSSYYYFSNNLFAKQKN